MPSAAAPPGFITVARVVKTQGRRGELGAELTTDFPDRFAVLERIYLWKPPAPPRSFPLLHHWFHKRLVILQLGGLEDLNAAEPWVGAEVQIPAAERVAIPPGSYFTSDLIGCDVYAGSRPIGRLRGLQTVSGAPDLLEIATAQGGEILIPFAAEYLQEIDLEARRIRLRLPDGLLELNAPEHLPERS